MNQHPTTYKSFMFIEAGIRQTGMFTYKRN